MAEPYPGWRADKLVVEVKYEKMCESKNIKEIYHGNSWRKGQRLIFNLKIAEKHIVAVTIKWQYNVKAIHKWTVLERKYNEITSQQVCE